MIFVNAFKAAGVDVEVSTMKKMFDTVKASLDDLSEVTAAAAAKDSAKFTTASAKFAGGTGQIARSQVDEILKFADDVAEFRLKGKKLTKAALYSDEVVRQGKSAQAAYVRAINLAGSSIDANKAKAILNAYKAASPQAYNTLMSMKSGPDIINGVFSFSSQQVKFYLSSLDSLIPGLIKELSEELVKKGIIPAGSSIKLGGTVRGGVDTGLTIKDSAGKTSRLNLVNIDGTYNKLGEMVLRSNAYTKYIDEMAKSYKNALDSGTAAMKGLTATSGPIPIQQVKNFLNNFFKNKVPNMSLAGVSSFFTGRVTDSIKYIKNPGGYVL
jgi:hypothetical protein